MSKEFVITKYVTESKKIAFNNAEELAQQLNSLGAYRIINIRRTTPDSTSTDTRQWYSVFYEKQV
jgi:hypothetical protein